MLTALTQIAAEELDVAPQRLRIVSGETTTSPAEGFTSGSNSIAISGTAIRLACAQVRALFLRHAADKLACAVEELSIDDSRFLRRGQATGLDYWSIAGEVDLNRPATGEAPTKPPSNYRLVGKNLPRLDLAEKMKGAAFIHDIAPANLLHARMLRRLNPRPPFRFRGGSRPRFALPIRYVPARVRFCPSLFCKFSHPSLLKVRVREPLWIYPTPRSLLPLRLIITQITEL